jgi:hypothetical protein
VAEEPLPDGKVGFASPAAGIILSGDLVKETMSQQDEWDVFQEKYVVTDTTIHTYCFYTRQPRARVAAALRMGGSRVGRHPRRVTSPPARTLQ